ncbi:MAG: hypothetical protein ACJAQ0_000084 [Dasania sp.]|jgi:hypothetical protein
MENKHKFLNTLIEASIPDLVETLSMCVNPAEADMLLTIALLKTYQKSMPEKFLINRFDYQESWKFFDKIFNIIANDSALSNHLSCEIIALYEQNPFSLSSDDSHNTAPYHPYLDQLPPLFFNNGTMINLKNAQFSGLIPTAANLDMNYQDVISKNDLMYEFKALNERDNPGEARAVRLDALTDVRYIKEHSYFPNLNGQRGVFAKQLIPSGTVLGYVTGDVRKMGDATPPMLCSWPMASYRFKMSFSLARHFVHSYTQWVDSYILGNRLKLVNSCIPDFNSYKPIKKSEAPFQGNVGCYFGHFTLSNEKPKYITVPFYMTLRDIAPDEELMTYYGCQKS